MIKGRHLRNAATSGNAPTASSQPDLASHHRAGLCNQTPSLLVTALSARVGS